MSPLFHLHIVSSPFLSFLPPEYPSQAPRMPPLSPHCVLAAHFGSLSLLGGLPGTSGTAPASLLPSNLAALWKSEGGGTLVVGKAFGSAKPLMRSRSAGRVSEKSCYFARSMSSYLGPQKMRASRKPWNWQLWPCPLVPWVPHRGKNSNLSSALESRQGGRPGLG